MTAIAGRGAGPIAGEGCQVAAARCWGHLAVLLGSEMESASWNHGQQAGTPALLATRVLKVPGHLFVGNHHS